MRPYATHEKSDSSQVSHVCGAGPSCENTMGAHTALSVASAVGAAQCRAVLEDTMVDVWGHLWKRS